MSSTISVRGLTKYYGRSRGIEDLDLDVEAGEVFGFLGPNGAGKTTTIRMLLDLIRPTRGSVRLLGLDLRGNSLALRRRMGYLPGELVLYSNLTGAEFLPFCARVRRCETQAGEKLADRLNLDLDRHVRDLSTGNKQKLGLIQALMHSPDLLVLDEPTSGLDPLARQEVHELLNETAARGGTVLLSSHVLHEVEQVAHRVAIVRAGHLLTVDRVDALKARAAHRYELEFATPPPLDAFASLPNVGDATVTGRILRCTIRGPVAPLLQAALAHGLEDVTRHDPDLEEIFLELIQNGGASDDH